MRLGTYKNVPLLSEPRLKKLTEKKSDNSGYIL